MSNNDSFFNTISNALFIMIGIPIIVIFILVLLIIQIIYGLVENNKYDNDPNIIMSSKIAERVYDEAVNTYDKNVFSKVELKKDNYNMPSQYSARIEYYFNDSNKSAIEYDKLIKNEVSNLYNNLKNKKIKKNQLFRNMRSESIEMTFYYPNKDKNIIGIAVLKYYEDKGFDNDTYQKIINSTIVTDEKLESIKKDT